MFVGGCRGGYDEPVLGRDQNRNRGVRNPNPAGLHSAGRKTGGPQAVIFQATPLTSTNDRTYVRHHGQVLAGLSVPVVSMGLTMKDA